MSEPASPPVPEASFAEFLESTPPGVWTRLVDQVEARANDLAPYGIPVPELQLHCGSCGGTRQFKHSSQSKANRDVVYFHKYPETLLSLFQCRNCGKSSKNFAWMRRNDGEALLAMKLGEHPAFGPPVPSRAIKLIGPDRELFLLGRRCENQGLGVGAFAYYRRVVDNQWRRLLDEIIRVAQVTGSSADTIDALQSAKEETQFTKAVADVGVPESLKIRGHNPLTLLYRALSDGLHDQSDKTCLQRAADVRVVLYELAERVAQAVKDEHELMAALGRLAPKP